MQKGTEMQRVVSKSILASIVSLAFVASIASAKWSFGHSSEKSANVELTQSAQIPNGPALQPGTYKVALLSDSATPQVGFYQNGKLVGQAAAQVVDQSKKSPDTEVHLNNAGGNSTVTEIDVSGWTKKIEFGQSGSSSSSQSGQ
jgi:hypothetical protein